MAKAGVSSGSGVFPRRVAFLVVALIIAASGSAGSAWASAQFGSRFLQTDCCTLYGGRSNIGQVGLSPSSALAAARVEADNAGAYLIQAGLIKSDVGWANCPNVSSRSRYYEALTPSGTFCNAYSDATLTRPAVLWSSAGPTTWSAWLDGTRVFRGDVGFGGALGYLSGDELNGSGGSVIAQYGNGDTPWQRATGRDGSGYFTIQQSHIFRQPPDKWSIGSLPSPFTISGP